MRRLSEWRVLYERCNTTGASATCVRWTRVAALVACLMHHDGVPPAAVCGVLDMLPASLCLRQVYADSSARLMFTSDAERCIALEVLTCPRRAGVTHDGAAPECVYHQ